MLSVSAKTSTAERHKTYPFDQTTVCTNSKIFFNTSVPHNNELHVQYDQYNTSAGELRQIYQHFLPARYARNKSIFYDHSRITTIIIL
jgi:hypothetical protein